MSLLTVNDQVAYQACINIIAEELSKKTRKRHRTTVFHHLYAGKSAPFFYLKWENSYRAYSNAVRFNFSCGLRYVASFDLTAFYDSIDHHVLKIFLRKCGIDPDTIDFLLSNLRHWTESTWSAGQNPLIFHEHGIPQGPAASGMLSEVILQHLDSIGDRKSRDVRYLRYVDDIKIMASDEKTLRRKLVALDLAAKEVGLFPQGAKIAVRHIVDPEDEIKSVSIPIEPADDPAATQDTIRSRIRVLSNRGQPKDTTRLRFILPRLHPSSKTNSHLYAVLTNRPDVSSSIIRHFEKYKKPPNSLAAKIIAEVTAEGVYHSVNADLLNLLYGRVDSARSAQIADFAYERLFAGRFRRSAFPVPQPTYKAALLRWALLSSRMTFSDVDSQIRQERDWWVRQSLLTHLDEGKFGRPSYELLLNIAMRASDPESTRVAASLIFDKSLSVRPPHSSYHWAARLLLRNVGLIRYEGRPPSLIPGILTYTLKYSGQYNWQHFFGSDHAPAERIAVMSKRRFETDIDAFVVSLDSFFELLLRQIYRHRGHTLRASYGNALRAGSPAWFSADFPILRNALTRLHDLRIRSFTAHPRHLKTGAVNRRITHSQYYRLRKALVFGLDELSIQLPI